MLWDSVFNNKIEASDPHFMQSHYPYTKRSYIIEGSLIAFSVIILSVASDI